MGKFLKQQNKKLLLYIYDVLMKAIRDNSRNVIKKMEILCSQWHSNNCDVSYYLATKATHTKQFSFTAITNLGKE